MLPGEALSETRLAEQHGISRTPVREVIQRLAKENLLAIVPQVGTFVAPIKLRPLPAASSSARQSNAARCALQRSARRARSLKHCVSRFPVKRPLSTKATLVTFFQLDERMHSLILDIAGHPQAWDLIASVKAQLDRVRRLSLEDKSWPKMIYRQHVEIIGAIRDKDPTGAEQAMQAHLRTVFDAVERLAKEHAQFFEQEPPALNRGIA